MPIQSTSFRPTDADVEAMEAIRYYYSQHDGLLLSNTQIISTALDYWVKNHPRITSIQTFAITAVLASLRKERDGIASFSYPDRYNAFQRAAAQAVQDLSALSDQNSLEQIKEQVVLPLAASMFMAMRDIGRLDIFHFIDWMEYLLTREGDFGLLEYYGVGWSPGLKIDAPRLAGMFSRRLGDEDGAIGDHGTGEVRLFRGPSKMEGNCLNNYSPVVAWAVYKPGGQDERDWLVIQEVEYNPETDTDAEEIERVRDRCEAELYLWNYRGRFPLTKIPDEYLDE